MAALFRKSLAFLKKDIITETSYKFNFLIQLAGIFFSTLTFFFLSQLIGSSVIEPLKPYGGDYFSFVLIGFAFSNYLQVSLQGFSKTIREAQMLGTLEALLVTQTGIPTIILSSSLYSFFMTSLRIIIFLALGSCAFGMNLAGANIVAALILIMLTITSFSSLGIISASFVMILKKGDPLAWIFTSLSWLLGGVYYPVSVLPQWMQKLSYLLPITYSLEGMRYALLQGYSLGELLPQIFALTVITATMLPMSLVVFNLAVKKAKIDGTLVQY